MLELFDMPGPGANMPGAQAALERGAVLASRGAGFALHEAERAILRQGLCAENAKNISFDPATGRLKHAGGGCDQAAVKAMLARYAAFAAGLVASIAPGYQAGLRTGRTSFRPANIESRASSWKKDDRLRHVDAFPSTPLHGARILRVFANVDETLPRRWRVGPDFEHFAARFLPGTGRLPPGGAMLLHRLGLTKSRRTFYDQIMLGLHDAAKRDLDWQNTAPARELAFAPGQVWLAFTDQVPHAAIAGRNALEQSFYIRPEALAAPAQAPLAILTRLTGRNLTHPLV